jgi:hypothetical protein
MTNDKVVKINTKAKFFAVMRQHPGILRTQLYKMNIGPRSSIQLWESKLLFEGKLVRIWDDVLGWQLYPKGKEPQHYKPEIYRPSLWSKEAAPDINKGHGEQFRMAFDEAFGILYYDLKIIAGACEAMK